MNAWDPGFVISLGLALVLCIMILLGESLKTEEPVPSQVGTGLCIQESGGSLVDGPEEARDSL